MDGPYKLKTIEELELYHYGTERSRFLAKADAPLTTGTTGVNNFIYGQYAWVQVNMEANVFGCLPKIPWDASGWRMVTSKAVLNTTNDNTVLGGTAEGGQVAEATKPDFVQTAILPQIAQLPFQTTTVREWLSSYGGDDYYGNGLDSMRLIMAVRHKEMMNQMLFADVESQAAGASGDYSPGKDWESLDRIVSSDAEEDQVGGTHAGWYDPWGKLDRDSSTTTDCTVETASGGDINSGNGALTDDIIRGWLKEHAERAGRDPSIILTGYDAYTEVQGVYTPQVEYNVLGEKAISVDVNGVSTTSGQGVGLHVPTLYGIPVIKSKDAPSNSGDTDEVGRMFGLDISDADGYGFPRLAIQVAIPTTYNEIGRDSQGFPWTSGGFVEEALYWTMGQIICRSFRSQSKLRDIRV